MFTAHKHIPAHSTHQTTLQGVVYQLDVALQSHQTQKAGIVFIYDMSNSKYSNFDYELSQKILTLLKVSRNFQSEISVRSCNATFSQKNSILMIKVENDVKKFRVSARYGPPIKEIDDWKAPNNV